MARIVFMGTPEFALPSLAALLDSHAVVAVVTQPDRPSGRRRRLRPSPVKRAALTAGIPLLQPERIRSDESISALQGMRADLFVVVAFGQILPQVLLDVPRIASINVHASLLPRWRGAAPIQAAIRAGDQETGVTLMMMDAGLDTGPVIAQRLAPIATGETGQSLHDKLARLGAELLVQALPDFLDGTVSPAPQEEDRATYAPAIKKEEGRLDWTGAAAELERTIRAFTPWPGSFTTWNGAPLKIHAGYAGAGLASPGLVLEHEKGIAIGTGAGLFFPTEVQLAGKKRLSIADFVNGHGDFPGAILA
ncbi:MAG: methionyl-tRNA formyltransferase [Chloroflexi bacterium]|nr:methionyl-tRNA formyltransferase [Chloroflexota bacterium]